MSIDILINNWFYNNLPSISHPLMTRIMNIIAIIFDPIVLGILSICFIIYFMYKKQWHSALLWGLTITSAMISVYIIKILVHRPRPEAILTDFSFPSGHCVVDLVFFLLLFYSFKDKIQKKMLVISTIAFIILLIGFNRLYLYAHWFSDVIGGYVLGMFWFTLYILILKIMFYKSISNKKE